MRNRDELKREWLELSQPWIKQAREGRNATRNGLLDLAMLEACGSVEDLRVLDCGCGEGRFCRMLVERGAAYALGLDLCEPMIEAASGLQSERDAYRVADLQILKAAGSEGILPETADQGSYAVIPLDDDLIDYLIERSPKFRADCSAIRGRMDAGESLTHEEVRRQLSGE